VRLTEQKTLETGESVPEHTSGLILGILLARNEWPLLGMCITHALTNHVDELLIIDHSSTDETEVGVASLQAKWGGRLQLMKLDKGPLHHQALNLVILEVVEKKRFSWIYHVDADEFLILPEKKSLKELLIGLPLDVEVVRYQLFNFIAPRDFREDDFEQYKELTSRAVIDGTSDRNFEELISRITNFQASFFDAPFPSKVIYRATVESWPIAGCHALVGKTETNESALGEEVIFAAHLPFLTRERLIRRADHGKELREAGYPRDFAWQSQVVDEMRSLGQLEKFWNSHSISPNYWESENKLPQAIYDTRLVNALSRTVITFMEDFTKFKNGQENIAGSSQESIALASAVNSVQRMAERKDLELSQLRDENFSLRNENRTVQQASFETAKRLESLHKSLSWRLTKPLRSIHRLSCYLK
jgi:hypothetical protein